MLKVVNWVIIFKWEEQLFVFFELEIKIITMGAYNTNGSQYYSKSIMYKTLSWSVLHYVFKYSTVLQQFAQQKKCWRKGIDVAKIT